MDSRKAVRNQLFAEIAVFCLDKRIKTLTATAAHRICHAGSHGERFGQFLSGERFGRFSYFDYLRHGHPKVFCLLNQSRRVCSIGLGGTDEIKSKDIFLSSNPSLEQ